MAVVFWQARRAQRQRAMAYRGRRGRARDNVRVKRVMDRPQKRDDARGVGGHASDGCRVPVGSRRMVSGRIGRYGDERGHKRRHERDAPMALMADGATRGVDVGHGGVVSPGGGCGAG